MATKVQPDTLTETASHEKKEKENHIIILINMHDLLSNRSISIAVRPMLKKRIIKSYHGHTVLRWLILQYKKERHHHHKSANKKFIVPLNLVNKLLSSKRFVSTSKK